MVKGLVVKNDAVSCKRINGMRVKIFFTERDDDVLDGGSEVQSV